jgi:methylenetetrahydrofolate dehydrogenase (NADP+) / methenyltetrahydrofolate cyclohydrolase
MSAIIIDGKAIAAALRAEIATRVAAHLAAGHRKPGLAVVLVGDNPASRVYVGSKVKQTIAAGMNSFEARLPEDVAEDVLLKLIDTLNGRPDVDGILVQLPLPSQINSDKVLNAIDPAKDVDGFHPINVGLLATGGKGFVPCTPKGAMRLVRSVRPNMAGLHAVIIGRSTIVGKPMAQLLLAADCTVTITHSRTRNLAEVCREADILVAAIGRAEMIGADFIKPGAIVIDVGINRIAGEGGTSRLVGDVDYSAASLIASAITPVPGGVGPMTIACLLENTLEAYERRIT